MIDVTLHEILKLGRHSISLLRRILMSLPEKLPISKLGLEGLSDFRHQIILFLHVLVECIRIVLIVIFVYFYQALHFVVDN